MLAVICLACFELRQGGVLGDPRLSKHLSMRHEIISLADLTAEMSREVGVALSVRRRLGDRKVTIVFKDRPASEAMNCLADCMLMNWRKDGSNSYELDLTSKASSAESRTEAVETERTQAGLRQVAREARRLWALSPETRTAEVQKLDLEFRTGLKSDPDAKSDRMQFLGAELSAVHSAFFIEVVGAAFAGAKLDESGTPVGGRWFASADAGDPCGHINVAEFQTSSRARDGGFTDAIGEVTYREATHSIESRLFAIGANEPGGTLETSAGGWSIPVTNQSAPTELERLMAEWRRPLTPETSGRKVDDPKGAPTSAYRSAMFGRAQLLVDLSDRSGVPIVADAFRKALTRPTWLTGKSVQDCLDSYVKISTAPYRGRSDYVREQNGWLMLRSDHWWWNLPSEIPESILRPLETQAIERSPLSLPAYLKLLTSLSPSQRAPLRHPESLLISFPVGSLGATGDSLTLFSLLDPAAQAQALSRDGLDLSTASGGAQASACNALLGIAMGSGREIALIRALLRGGRDALKDFRFYAEDEAGRTTDAAKIGDGKDIRLSFSYGPNNRHVETFSCTQGGE